MSDTSLNKYLAQGDDAAEAAFTPDPVTGTTPEQAVLFVNAETPATPILKWWDGSAFVDVSSGAGAITRSIGCVIDGGGSAITTGVKADIYIPFACTITAVTMLADQSGSAVIDIWKDAYANYPPTVADTITASAKPTISSAIKSQDTTLTGWTTSVSAGDTLRFNVDSATTITRLTLVLTVTS